MPTSETHLEAVSVTHGPKHHFFGYYGICPWNASGTHLLCLESDFHDRLPTAADQATVGLVAFLVLFLAWFGAQRMTGSAQLRFPSRPWWAILVDVLYLEVHWAFYRGALSVALDDLYAAVFWGLCLVYVEWALSPFWRQGWRLRSQAAQRWLRAALALVIALLFFLTRNLWVCLGVHWLLELIFWHLGRERTRAVAMGDSPLP